MRTELAKDSSDYDDQDIDGSIKGSINKGFNKLSNLNMILLMNSPLVVIIALKQFEFNFIFHVKW